MGFQALYSLPKDLSYAHAIVSGGDSRLDLNERMENKYYVNPFQTEGVFNRGSCTNSPLTPDGNKAAKSLFERLQSGAISYEKAVENTRKEILGIYDPLNTHGTSLIFAPSGSDLCYLPLMFARSLAPQKPIMNLVTCTEELGSGSVLAHQGQYFAERTQVAAFNPVGDQVSQNLDIQYLPYNARSKGGKVNDFSEDIRAKVKKYSQKYSVIVSLVLGSKSGIKNNLKIIEELRDYPVIWSVDLCQMRASPGLVRKLLNLNCLLFITGSKFYQAPAFCGGLLMSGEWLEKLSRLQPDQLKGFDRYFTRHDMPVELYGFRRKLPAIRNYGLMLRWQAALAEMTAFHKVKPVKLRKVIQQWNIDIENELENRPVFKVMSGQKKTNKSIISFKLRGKNGFLQRPQMAEIHKLLATRKREMVPAFDKVLIGQPVDYPSGTFLRFALGAHDVRQFANNGYEFKYDIELIDAVERIIREQGW